MTSFLLEALRIKEGNKESYSILKKNLSTVSFYFQTISIDIQEGLFCQYRQELMIYISILTSPCNF